MKEYLEDYEKWNERMFVKYELGDRLLKHPNPYIRWRENRKFDLVKNLCRIGKNDRVLDAGFGNGETLKRINRGHLYGIDLSDTAMGVAGARLRGKKNLVELKKSKLENTGYPDGFFDRIICMEVFEHVIDLEKLILELARVLKKDGLLVITTPSPMLEKFKGVLFKIGLKSLFRGITLKPEAHLREMTKKDLYKSLDGAGFRVEKLYYYPFYFFGETLIARARK